jgi:flagellar hook-length control protein FliK
MNLTGILHTLGTLANAASSSAQPQQQSGPSFDQVLSQNIAQQQPQQAPTPAQPPAQQPAQAQSQRGQEHDAQASDGSKAATTQNTQGAQTNATKGSDAKSGDAKAADAGSADKDAAADGKDALADIPGASQAALMMQLMQAASAAAARPDAKLAAKDAPLADADAKSGASGRAGILAATDDKPPRIAPQDLAAAAAAGDAAPLKTGDDYARLMHDALDARQAGDAQQVQDQQPDQPPLPAAALTAALQQTSTAVAAAQAGAETRLAPPVGSTAWDNAVGQKVVWMAANGEHSASLTLNPPDLGPMQVVLAVNNNHATVNFSAPQPEVRQALEAALPRLKEMMSDAGIQLGQANVGAGSQGQFAGFDRGNGGDDGNGRRQRGGDAFAVGGVTATDTRVRQGRIRIAPDGAVDTFA